MAKWNRHMTIRQAAELLGEGSDEAAWARVRRLIRKKERDTSQTILVDVGTGNAPRWRVTEAQLRKHFPECFSRRDQAIEDIEKRDAEFWSELLSQRLVLKAFGVRLRALARDVSGMKNRIGQPT